MVNDREMIEGRRKRKIIKHINKQRHPRPLCDQLQRVFLLFVDNP